MSPEDRKEGDFSHEGLVHAMHDHDDENDGWVRYDAKGKRVQGKPETRPPAPEPAPADEEGDADSEPTSPDRMPTKKDGLGSDKELVEDADNDPHRVDYDGDGELVQSTFDDEDQKPGEVFGDYQAEEAPVSVVSSNPPDRTPDEQEFSTWMHAYPIHEGDHQFEWMKQLGVEDVHQPDPSEDEDEQDATAADQGSEGGEVPQSGGSQPEDFSYLDQFDGGGKQRTPPRAAG